MTFEFSGTGSYNTGSMGRYTYAGEDNNGKPWFEHSGVFCRMYLTDDGEYLGIASTEVNLGVFAFYWATYDVDWPTEANGAWQVYDGSSWVPMTAEEASVECVEFALYEEPCESKVNDATLCEDAARVRRRN